MNSLKYISVLCLIAAFSSCQKVITVNLNASSPKYVITGNVTTEPGPYTIQVARSVNFDEDNNFPGVNNASVYITDITANLTDTLSLVSAGRYRTHALQGVVGHTYHLSITADGNNFTSSSTIPAPVSLDSVYLEKATFGKKLDIVPLYKDPVGTGNYYHLVLTVRDSVSQEIYLHSDGLSDGVQVKNTLRNDIDIQSGDAVTVALQCIDYGVFQYYRNLQQTIEQNSASPANPQSNITGGALGYFSACTVSRRSIVAL